MSSILKALRKIEEEKRVASNVAPDLRMDQGHSAKQARPFLPLVAGIAFGAVCVSLFFVWFYSTPGEVATRPVQQSDVVASGNLRDARPSVVAEEERAEPSLSISQTNPVPERPAAPAADAQKVLEVILPVEAVPVAKTPVTEAPVTEAPVTKAPVTKAPVTKAPVAIENTQEKITDVKFNPPQDAVVPLNKTHPMASDVKPEPIGMEIKTLPADIVLNVSETFYYEDPANSMAVVNDLPVMIGSFVDSAEVIEIHQDKVIFKIDQNTYDVRVSPPH